MHCSLIWAQTLILNCTLDITSCMSQRHLKLKLIVPQTKVIISFTPQNLVLFQGSLSELIHHPTSSTSQKPIMFDTVFLSYCTQFITKSCPFYLFNVSQIIYSLPSPPPLPPLTHYLSQGPQQWPPNRAKYFHSGSFQYVLHTWGQIIISEHKTNHGTCIFGLKSLDVSALLLESG